MALSPVYVDNLLDTFPYLEEDTCRRSEEEQRLAELYKHRDEYTYTIAGPESTYQQHELSASTKTERPENFEQFFWRLQDEQDDADAEVGRITSDKLHELHEKIAESHLWRRLKWLGIPDWRSKSYAAKTVGSTLPPWCASLKTVSIRGKYTRDRSANEFESIHHHVCRFILGIVRIVPASVVKLELRLSVSFLRYFLEQLQKEKPSIKQVGIDLGAWVHVFPLGNPPDHLKDDDIRATTRRLVRKVPKFEIFYPKTGEHGINEGRYIIEQEAFHTRESYEAEQEYLAAQYNFYRDRSGTFERYCPLKLAPQARSLSKSSTEHYDFFEDLRYNRITQDDVCPLDDSKRHSKTKNEVNRTCANTLSKLLEKLHLARRAVGESTDQANLGMRVGKPKFVIKREGAELFGLHGETQTRSFDPIDPLTLTQQEVKMELRAGNDYQFFTPEGLKAVYPWLEQTFKWRPVFDWNWFMVPRTMSVTENPNLVTINRSGTGPKGPTDWKLEGLQSERVIRRGNELEKSLAFIKIQFGLLNEANIPVHLLIGRRHPDLSSSYWGWPYTKELWREWNEQIFSANLETIAEHVNTLSIFYDLRNPLDTDRLALIDAKRPYHPPHGRCHTRVCLLEKANNGKCPFVEKYPGQRNRHPRPQASGAHKPHKTGSKRNAGSSLPTYSGLAEGGSFGPITGEHADDEAKEDDSDDNEVFPLRLARRSVYLRESVGWVRFWDAYASSFRKLTALHLRMPQCNDVVASWRLARLLNRRNGWHLLTYADERQHMQTEEDLLRTFDDNAGAVKKRVWWHQKESRFWPAGRFVRRSWIWDPLQLVDERSEIIFKPKVDPEDDFEEPQRVEKKYHAYRFRPRKKMDLSTHDNDIETGEIDGLLAARRDVGLAIANEDANGDPRDEDGRSIKPEGERIPQPVRLPHHISGFAGEFQSVYGHHIRNVAGGQWREELREMIAAIDRLRRTDGGGLIEDEELVEKERAKLKALLGDEPPYSLIFDVDGDTIVLRDVPEREWDGDDDDAGPDTRRSTDNGQEMYLKDQEGVEQVRSSSAPLLPGSGEALPGESGADTDVDSLFIDSNSDETIQIASSPLTSPSPKRKPSAEDASPGRESSSPPPGPTRPPVAGPFDQSSSSSDESGEDAQKASALLPVTIPPHVNPPEGVMRTPRTPIDEDYTDNDDFDDDGNPTDTEGLYTSAEQLGPENKQPEAVQSRPQSDYFKNKQKKKTEAAAAAASEAHKENKKGGMCFMEWLSQKNAAANAIAAFPPPGNAGPGAESSASSSSSKRKKSETAPDDAAISQKPKIFNEAKHPSPEPAPESSSTKKRKQPSTAPDAGAHPKKPKVSDAAKDPAPEPTLEASSTKSGRPINKTVVSEPSDHGGASDDPQKKRYSKSDYVPSPTKEQPSSDDGESEEEANVAKKPTKKPSKKDKGEANAAPAAAPAAPTIRVPTAANMQPDYSKLTVVQLRALAKQRGLRLTGARLKADIIAKFEEDDAS
jgi:hypothetical protein